MKEIVRNININDEKDELSQDSRNNKKNFEITELSKKNILYI